MVLGRLVHYTLDVVLISTVLAGVKRHTGFQSVHQSSRFPLFQPLRACSVSGGIQQALLKAAPVLRGYGDGGHEDLSTRVVITRQSDRQRAKSATARSFDLQGIRRASVEASFPARMALRAGKKAKERLPIQDAQVNTGSMPDGPVRHTADTLLFAGDRVFDIVAATSFSSSWFEKETRKPNAP
ncbi:hypothetical protein BMF94_2483 [Rhodotorula taiwanensis]|uniref:DUF1748-domain-containing protein n=1 Tax=Rhodotorula taiwanensis TaxID=741276 RepID=A0A2S5BCI0_9BASI|nr:hypothetical protein BMF94_2483 [Rhodotorula taiwanensis]